MISVDCIMVVFDSFYSLELIYLANYANISHYQAFPYILFKKWLKITFCFLKACSFSQRKLKFEGELFLPSGRYYEILPLAFLELNGRAKCVS